MPRPAIAESRCSITFAPYQCGFTDDTPASFSVTPTAGTMNRRSGDPVNVIVRFSPKEYGEPMSATLVFETEDMKQAHKFTGGPACGLATDDA